MMDQCNKVMYAVVNLEKIEGTGANVGRQILRSMRRQIRMANDILDIN